MTRPPLHGRDHAPGGADPIPGAGAGGIEYDVANVGGWLQVDTVQTAGGALGEDSTARGMVLRDQSSDGLELVSKPGVERDTAEPRVGAGAGIYLRTLNGAQLFMPDVPTADPGDPDAVWNDGGTLVMSGSTAGGGSVDISGKVDRDAVEAATARLVQVKLAAGDTQPAFRIKGDGTHEWGPGGTAATDTALYRFGANRLKTDASFEPGSITTSGYISAGTGANQVLFYTDGKIYFSDLGDVNLWRSGSNVLHTDDEFECLMAAAGAVKRLVVGAADSGGSGFRMVRVTN